MTFESFDTGRGSDTGPAHSPDLARALSRLWLTLAGAVPDNARPAVPGNARPDGAVPDNAAAPSSAGEARTFDRDLGLLPVLPIDAALARLGDADTKSEAMRYVPRLVELVVGHGLEIDQAVDTVDRLARGRWADQWRTAVVEVLDQWWIQALRRDPGDQPVRYPASVVLGVVSGFGSRMSRWLAPWIDELDGPGAQHLADTILGGLEGPAWRGKDDEATQVLGWARTEPVVTGVSLVGAVHLDADISDRLLDRLLRLDEPIPGLPTPSPWPW